MDSVGSICKATVTRPGVRDEHVIEGRTMTKIEIELPEATAKAVRVVGPLTSQALGRQPYRCLRAR